MSIFDGIFGSKKWEEEEKLFLEKEENLKLEITELAEDLAVKDKALKDMKEDLIKAQDELAKAHEEINKYKTRESIPKQDEVIFKNLEEARKENEKLRKLAKKYNLNIDEVNHYYRVDVDRFFASTKFKELVKYLHGNKIKFIEDLDLSGLTAIKNIKEARKKLEKFNSREFVEWEILTYMDRGDRVSRLFSKSRKLCNIFIDEGIEYVEDLKKFDFSKLLIYKFDPESITQFKKIRDNYYKERRITK